MKKTSLALVVALGAFSLLFFGIKFFVIAHYGSATPYWDQWDAEAANLYQPWLEGRLSFQQLVAPHNEHRIVTTRLLALLLLKLNGLWNPLLQMCVNTMIHLVVILMSLFLIAYGYGKKIFFPLLFFSSFLFFIPYAWENTLAGFQAQFYFVLFFSVLTLFLLIEKKLFTPLWSLGLLSGVLAFFSLASGILSAAAVVAVFCLHYALGIDRSWKKIIAALALILLVALGILFTPTITGHAPLKAHSAKQFAAVFITIMSWPLPGNFFWFLFRNAPALVFCDALFLGRPQVNDRRWFLLGLIIWTTLQAMSIAYGRAEGCLSSRYLDLFAFSVLMNFACLLNEYSFKNLFRKSVVVLWTVVIVTALARSSYKDLPEQLAEKRRTEMAQTFNLQNYQRSGNIDDLKNKPFQEIPYPDPARLAMLLSSPTIQKILPTNIQKTGTEISVPVGRLDGVIDWILSHPLLFIALGVVIALIALIC
ncbi:MAG: hypothetical protein ACOYK6_00875 [Chthoniobacterales bacterium]